MAPLSCVRVYTDPWIACPIDRVEELEPDKSTVVLGYKWQLPRTNMKNVTVSPSNYDENYPFPVGRHRVTWIGTSDSGTQKSCSFYVTVNDVTAPSVQGCPASFSDKTNSLQKKVTWKPPTFTDNVGVASVLSNRQPGFEMKTYTSLTIRYTATDAAGNVAYCIFNITLEGSTCITIPHPKNGVAMKLGLFLQLRCNPGYFFNPSPPGLPGLFQNPYYRCMGNKWVSQNDRVSILTKPPDCMAYVSYDGSFCHDGSILLQTICLNCPPGTYSEGTTNICKDCNAGFYQDEEGKTECQPCPKNFSSVITGSKSKADCKPVCRPGHYSTNNGIEPCLECPMGTYQDNDQQTYCHACPAGTNTASTGSTSLEDCLSPVRITQIIPTSEYTTYENETFSLACYIAGDPTPTVTWTKVGGSLPSSERLTVNNVYDLDLTLTGVELTISGAVVADSGDYECKATNKHGSVTKQVKIDVEAGTTPGVVSG